jgi:hypothetical protein
MANGDNYCPSLSFVQQHTLQQRHAFKIQSGKWFIQQQHVWAMN